jgi:hypothetical protein
MSRRTLVVTVVAAMLLTGSAIAHHNMTAIFDLQNKVALNGKLTKLDWRNPHIYMYVDVTVDGKVQSWSLEGPAPVFFRSRDITKDDVAAAVGQQITAEGSRARDGSHSALLRVMNLPGGKVLSACPQNC